jgi:hypothetical protein
MPTLFVFLLKVNVALLLFCAGYFLVLRHLTFYTLNRIYLVGAIIFATIYPKINLSDFALQHQEIVKPVEAIAYHWQPSTKNLGSSVSTPNYWHWAAIAFWAGAILLSLRLLQQLYSLFKLYRSSTPAQIEDHNIRVINADVSPFSFWKSIYVNPTNHTPDDLKAILLHEQVHVSEWHTLDILLAELSTIFYWFNPGVWLMKKAVRENIEFITDRKILRGGINTKQYQYSLVNVSFAASSNSIVNHFNISTIKKRIIMMNAKRSSNFKLTRYAFLIPAVVALLLVFSISKAALPTKTNAVFPALIDKIMTNNPISEKNIKRTVKDAKRSKVAIHDNTGKIAVKTEDTIKKGNISISTSAKADSVNYVINGAKASKKDFDAIDPGQIYSMELMPADQAAKIYPQAAGNKNKVLFVTTGDSEAGRKFKEKIDKLYSDGNAKGISIGGFAKNGPASSSVTVGDGTSGGTVVVNTVTTSPDMVRFRVAPKPFKLKSGKPMIVTYSSDSLVKVEPFIVRPDGKDSLKVFAYSVGSDNYIIAPKYKPMRLKKMTYNVDSRHYTPRAAIVSDEGIDEETNIDHLSSKLIMINGKEAKQSDLKKLSAADIESMNIKSGEEVIKKYGDKAKNGVVFISTKKVPK